MLVFIILAAVVVIATSRTPEEWKQILNSVEE